MRIGTSLRDLRSFPSAVRIDIGHALFTAPEGETDPAAKPLTIPSDVSALSEARFSEKSSGEHGARRELQN
jgi:phage-related protein